MKFIVSSGVFEQHPSLTIGVVIATGIDNTGVHPEISAMLREEERRIIANLTAESFKNHPHIAAMQEVHRSFGNNPNKFPPSVQALVKRILKGGQLPSINALVDIYNVISLRYVSCAGAEDMDACTGDIRLTFADGTEQFLPLGEAAEDPPERGELVYKDDAGAICRKLNWREGDRTKITEATKNAVFVVEGFPPFSSEELQKALQELSVMIRKYCGAECRIETLARGCAECAVG